MAAAQHGVAADDGDDIRMFDRRRAGPARRTCGTFGVAFQTLRSSPESRSHEPGDLRLESP